MTTTTTTTTAELDLLKKRRGELAMGAQHAVVQGLEIPAALIEELRVVDEELARLQK
ncbi:MAG: hypothetical protein Q8O67_06295 [Deltaproteobacteria bacterium]|nr:hypothetical protein [Deltaproteobacteria bacterium]